MCTPTQATMQALTLHPKSPSIQVEQLPIPVPDPNELLIRVAAVALNPVDWMFAAHPIAKQEFVNRGSAAEAQEIPIGMRVAGFLQGACSTNERPGAFAEYVTIPWDLVWHVPSHLSLEQAASVSMCGLTAAQAVFGRLGLPCPFSTSLPPSPLISNPASAEPLNILVYGSSTSLGLYVAQLLHLTSQVSSLLIRLIGVASPSKHALLQQKPYSYTALVDYRSPTWVSDVLSLTNGRGIDYAVDCISEGSTVVQVERTFGSRGGKLAVIRAPANGGYDVSGMRVKPAYGAVWEGLGVEVGFLNGLTLPANPQARKFAVDFYKFLSSGTEHGKSMLEPNPVRIMPGGLDKIASDGFALLGSIRVSEREVSDRTEDYMRPISMEKLVYPLTSKDIMGLGL
ncbi:GroES-like protein [Annulohypoxylon nitens]|nr:GroES-like protein [Annulohypoxylon nitens]